MRECAKKPLTVALAAVLVFMALFPVPVGARSLDRARFQEANANPAVAAPLIITTALAACGVYVAGYDMTAYANNQQTISGQFIEFCADNLYHEDIDAATAAIQSAVTPGGAIDMGVLSSLGILGLIPNFATGLLEGGQAVSGDNSLAGSTGVLYIGNKPFPTIQNTPSFLTNAQDKVARRTGRNDYDFVALWVGVSPTYNYIMRYYFYFAPSGATWNFYDYTSYQAVKSDGIYEVQINQDTRNGELTTFNADSVSVEFSNSSYLLNPDYEWVMRNEGVVTSTGFVSTSAAVVNGTIAANTAAYPTTQVQPFEPTAEQLATGYDVSAILEAINSNTGTIEGVAAQLGSIAGLLSPVAGIAANVQSIKDAWTTTMTAQATPFPWLNSLLSPITAGVQAVQSWIGDTPFPNIMQTVLDGVQAIPDGIRNLGDDLTGSLEGVLDGVLSIPGTLEGVLDGVLEGVKAIPGSIAQVIEAVQAGVVDLTGALDAVMHPQLPQFEPPSGSIAVPPGTLQAAEFDINDKVPFCYVIRARDAIGSMFANFSGNRSFYFDLDIPNAGTVTFDGEVVLSQSMGGLDIATTIRILATALLCLGLLYRAYKVVERSSGSI